MTMKKNLNSLEEAWNEIHSLEQQNVLLESQLRTKQQALDEALGEVGKVRRCLAFFRSVILSGESWSDRCQQEYDYTLAGPPPDEKEE
jgi:hypothetical protein